MMLMIALLLTVSGEITLGKGNSESLDSNWANNESEFIQQPQESDVDYGESSCGGEAKTPSAHKDRLAIGDTQW